MTSLNGGTGMRPLSVHSIAALQRLRHGRRPRQDFNPGVVDRLCRGYLVEIVLAASPYATVTGNVEWLRITKAGLKAIEAAP